MSWAKIDDRLHSHTKVRKAGLEAMGLWVLCLSHCAAQLTDGFVDMVDIETTDGAAAVRCTRCKVAERYAGTMKDLGRWVGAVTARHERCETRLLNNEAAE